MQTAYSESANAEVGRVLRVRLVGYERQDPETPSDSLVEVGVLARQRASRGQEKELRSLTLDESWSPGTGESEYTF